MENVFLTSLTTPEVKELFRNELIQFFGENPQEAKDPKKSSKPITQKALCAYLDVTEPTIIRWRKKGKIPFMQIGSAIRYDIDLVTAALEVDNKKKGLKNA